MRAGFRECRNAFVTRFNHFLEGVVAAQVHYIDRRICHFCKRDCSVDAFCFCLSGASESVIFRCRVTLSQGPLNYFVDDDAVFGMHAHQAAFVSAEVHGSKNGGIVDQ